MSLILGINAHNHNSSATLVLDGKIVFAAEEERFDREKHSEAFPAQALQRGLDGIGAKAEDIDAAGYCWDWRLGVAPRMRAALQRAWDPVSVYYLAGVDRAGRLGRIGGLEQELRKAGVTKASFHKLPHHFCHAATAFLTSQFEEAAVLSVDGVGEWATAWMGRGSGLELKQTGGASFPHSLGLAYDAVTEFVGFDKRSGAGKTMGLAAYGDAKRFERFFREWIVLLDDGGFAVRQGPVTWNRYFGYGGVPLFSKEMVEALGRPCAKGAVWEQHHADAAAGMQKRFEEAMLHMARHLKKSTGAKGIGLAGGCALNCLANSRIAAESGFEEVFAFPAAHDAGAGTGAAAALCALLDRKRAMWEGAYLGNAVSRDEAVRAFSEAGLDFEEPGDFCKRTAELLEAGAVVGWVQGRMEFGPRALGNRSLLADPRGAGMKDRLNKKVKHREAFRPFAPACPLEARAEWFEGVDASPWMMFAARVRSEKAGELGAVSHEDGTARLQTVNRGENPIFHELLLAFGKKTGVPVLVNTSLNVAGEPVVATARDAVRCFLSTEMDALVVDGCVALKSGSAFRG